MHLGVKRKPNFHHEMVNNKTYHNRSKRCNCCLEEKLLIMKANKATLVNKRTELFSECCHQNKSHLQIICRKKTGNTTITPIFRLLHWYYKKKSWSRTFSNMKLWVAINLLQEIYVCIYMQIEHFVLSFTDKLWYNKMYVCRLNIYAYMWNFLKVVLPIYSFGLELSTRFIQSLSEVNGSFCPQAFVTGVSVNVW